MQRDVQPTTYIMASARNGTLYIGVTSNLIQRIAHHREGTASGFTTRYAVGNLACFEQHTTMEQAITREKQLKKWNRAWKIRMIQQANPDWRDLAEDLGFAPLR